MESKINQTVISLVEGDITREQTEVIVNAANSRLAGGGGVDGAIHRVGGPIIMEECRKIGGCPTGKAVITSGGNLYARYVIHAVGPIYRGGDKNEAEMLAGAYQESLKLVSEKGLTSVAFPSLSTGAYGYPIKEAARIALKTVIDYATDSPSIKLIRFNLFGLKDYGIYEETFEELEKS